MTFFAIALMLLTAVILIVSLSYIISTHRHKETLFMLEKGLDPKDYRKDRFFLQSVKLGMLLVGIGLGFFTATMVDEFILIGIDNPGIYPACVLPCAGMSLLLFYKTFNTYESDEE